MEELGIESEGLAFARRIFEDIGSITKDASAGYTREGYSPVENLVHEYFKGIGAQLGLEQRTDAAGNLYLTCPGERRELPAFVSGSHADSVPQGGDYDGIAGIAAALTVAWWMRRRGLRPLRDFTVLVTRLESSAFYGKAYVGSLAMTGRLRPEDLALRHRTKSLTLGEAIRLAGFDPAAMVTGRPLVDLSRFSAFVELHIEQGPKLDANPVKRIGIVTGVRGNLRHKRIACIGETAHSGAVDFEFRHDAVLATAELLLSMEKHWKHRLDREEDLVFTAGVVSTGPAAAISKVPGLVTFCTDMRSLSMGTLERFHEMLELDAARISRKRGVRFELDPLQRTSSARLDNRLVARLAITASENGIPYIAMASGAGHDAAVLSNSGVPAAMIFVANEHGSHNPNEAMEMKDFMQGVKLLWKVVEGFDA